MKNIIYITFILIFLFSSLNLTEGLNITGVFIVYIILLSFFVIPIFIRGKLRVNLPTIITMYFFVLFSAISSYNNMDLKSLFGASMIFILYLVSCIIVPSLNFNFNKIIASTVLISHLPLIIFPIIANGFNTIPYKGIFYNPNSMGTVAGTIFAILLSGLLSDLEYIITGRKKNEKVNLIFRGLLLIGTLYLITISSSRTSFLAVILCLLVGTTYLSVYFIKNKKFVNYIFRGGIILVISSIFFLLILKFTEFNEAIYNSIFYKFELRSSQSGGVLSSRDNIWSKTIQEAGIFGNGNTYFTDMGIGAHNTFISILGEYGWFSLISFIMFLVIGLYYSTKYSLSNINDRYKYLPLMMFIVFVTMSMGEVMIFKISMIAMFLSLGAAMNRKESGNKRIPIQSAWNVDRPLMQ
ncbi:O-antigen ligase family protein [Thalassobacillus sp. B23F22_16]|uniref:O-antigen ligase family protein n=1 Tax=Thalassobacillus sp. B23F22_16 TaxID=3459513 RepID=UPI00373F4691